MVPGGRGPAWLRTALPQPPADAPRQAAVQGLQLQPSRHGRRGLQGQVAPREVSMGFRAVAARAGLARNRRYLLEPLLPPLE